MTAEHAPDFITSHPDKTVRSILYVCWVATFNTPEHHMGLPLAQSQVRCMLFACNDGRNAGRRDEIDGNVYWIVHRISRWSAHQFSNDRVGAVASAESLARLRDMVVTP